MDFFRRGHPVSAVLFLLVAAGCGGGSPEEAVEEPINPPAETAFNLSVSGSVGDGPIADALITVFAASGAQLVSVSGDQFANFALELEVERDAFPLQLTATGGVDLVTNLAPDFHLRAAVPLPSGVTSGAVSETLNLSPFSTLMTATAGQMTGGLTRSNLRIAERDLLDALNSGLTTLADGGTVSTPIGEQNIAEIVRASESLAEVLRRTDAVVVAARGVSDIELVIRSLGADLVDGVINGQGAAGVDPLVSAAAVIAAAQVAVETMINDLHVHGAPATDALDRVINQLLESPAVSPTAALPVTTGLLAAAERGIAAAAALELTATVEALQLALAAVQPGASSADALSTVGAGSGDSFNSILTRISHGLASDLAAVNGTDSANGPGAGSGGSGGNAGTTFGEWPAEVPRPFTGWEALPDCVLPAFNPDGPFDALQLNLEQCAVRNLHTTGWRLRVTGNNIAIMDSSFGYTDRNALALNGSNIVVYNVEVMVTRGDDRHCITAGGGSSHIWIYRSRLHDCSGDGFQAGHLQSASRPSNVYIVQNTIYDNRENGLDYKYMQNVYAAENSIFSHYSAPNDANWCPPNEPDPAWCSVSSSGSDGAGIVIGSDGAPINTYHFRNQVFASGKGIRIEDAEGEIVLEGNVIHDVTGPCLQLDKLGIGIRFAMNDCQRAGRGIHQAWREFFSLNVIGNHFADIAGPAIEYEAGSVGDQSTLVDNVFSNAGAVIYNNTTAVTAAEINALPGASGNIVSD